MHGIPPGNQPPTGAEQTPSGKPVQDHKSETDLQNVLVPPSEITSREMHVEEKQLINQAGPQRYPLPLEAHLNHYQNTRLQFNLLSSEIFRILKKQKEERINGLHEKFLAAHIQKIETIVQEVSKKIPSGTDRNDVLKTLFENQEITKSEYDTVSAYYNSQSSTNLGQNWFNLDNPVVVNLALKRIPNFSDQDSIYDEAPDRDLYSCANEIAFQLSCLTEGPDALAIIQTFPRNQVHPI